MRHIDDGHKVFILVKLVLFIKISILIKMQIHQPEK